MSEKLLVKRPVYPLIGLLASILIIVFGVVTAKEPVLSLVSGRDVAGDAGLWLLARLPCGDPCRRRRVRGPCGDHLCHFQRRSGRYAAVNRILAVCIAVIPGLALSPIILVRNFSTIKLPRMLTLGMMITLTFFPLLGGEVRQVREAMKTRGAGSFLSPQIFYRAFLIPLIMRLVNISDTLALSVETRGFDRDSTECSVYKTVNLHAADILFFLLVLAGVVWAVVAR